MSQLNKEQTDLLFHHLNLHFSDEQIETLITTFPLTGSDGLRKMLGEIDILYFAKAYLPQQFDREMCEFHKELIQSVQDLTSQYSCSTKAEEAIYRSEKTGQKLLTIAPRGHGKSRIITLLLNLWKLVYRKSPFILCISANDALAQSFLELIKEALEDGEQILEDFGNLKGDIWNKTQINLKNDTSLIAKGIKSKLRGATSGIWRPTSVVMDDIEDDKQASSELSTDEIKHIFRNTIMSIGDRYTDYIFLGTIISENTLINELYKTGTGWKKLFYQAVHSFSDSPLWEQWETIYTDLSNLNNKDDADAFYNDKKEEMLQGTSVLWEAKNDYYYLMKQKIDNGNHAFYAEQQNDPRSSSDYIFQKLTYHTELPEFKDMDIILGVDPSMGGKGSDFSALCIMGKHKKTGYKYVIDGQLHKVKPNELIDMIIKLCEEYPDITTIAFESISFQQFMSDDLKAKLKDAEMYHVIVKDIKPRTNKHNRIVNLEPFITRGEIQFNKDSKRFNTQVEDYSISAKNDDAPDVLQMCFEVIEKVRKPMKIQPIPSWLR